ncbi:hypothetical protein WICMUC_005634 [Wickerhamomyces mucosus]|uniref:Uncharacterized protein n=1 Tax=Wickerhamomyces mucosus TaxID=1378264 RepID=A0A9P8P7R0_9ASCO|nr:hypothetical protein WICMUC_005634 [Wickerhamomyces mucosus]
MLRQLLSPSSLFRFITNPSTLKITHNNVTKTISLSLIKDYLKYQQELQLKNDQMKYLSEYSYMNLESNYKSWFELTQREQFKFIDDYLNLHNLKSKPHKLGDLNKVIKDNQNDIHFLFSYLYQEIKTFADKEFFNNNDNTNPNEADSVIVKDSEIYGLLFSKKLDYMK